MSSLTESPWSHKSDVEHEVVQKKPRVDVEEVMKIVICSAICSDAEVGFSFPESLLLCAFVYVDGRHF